MEVAGSVREEVPYILMHSPREIRRLRHQAEIINPVTRRIFAAAGIAEGMSVLDVGCGAGDVSFMLSEMVGESGNVVGVDRVPAALEAAEKRAANHPLKNVAFREGDPALLRFDRSFDAVVGRYVLMFQADPVAMLEGVARHARPGGIIAFHEPDWDGARSNPRSSAYDRCCRWIMETFERTGIDIHMGNGLYPAFLAAGLGAPHMSLESIIGGTEGGADWALQTFELVVTMRPEIIGCGVATEMEVDLERLHAELERQVAAGAVIVSRSEIGAWSRIER